MAHFLIQSIAPSVAADTVATRSTRLFAEFVARATGLEAIDNAQSSTFGGTRDLQRAIDNAHKLFKAGIAASWGRARAYPDEPRICSWWVKHTKGDSVSGGLSITSDADALRAATSEAQERWIWNHEQDHFRGEIVASLSELDATHAVDPLSFAGHSLEQRQEHPNRTLSGETPLLWIKGYSMTRNEEVMLPAQVVSPHCAVKESRACKEPMIREQMTTGLAAHPDRTYAIASGALEVIERDAFMIMWLNQLSLPRVAHCKVTDENGALQILLERCSHLGLDVHFVRLITDAPCYAIMAVVKDRRMLPPYSIGTAAHRAADCAAEKALLEALRARSNSRSLLKTHGPFTKTPGHIRHEERYLYWAEPARSHCLDFLIAGDEAAFTRGSWEDDSAEAHLRRISAWCSEAQYQFVTVDLGLSKGNALGLNVFFSVIPELQPLYLNERHRTESGTRLRSIPERFGYMPRETPFDGEPHPFV